ncbi:MAG: hypothetical protein R2707_13745 [Acidimicrobiales bacterium]
MSADGWIARRPTIDIAAGRARFVVVAKAVVRPRMGRFRTRLVGSASGGILAGIGTARRRAIRPGTPIGFPQDAGGSAIDLSQLPDPGSRAFDRLARRGRRAGVVRLDEGLTATAAAGVVRLAESGVPLVAPGLSSSLRSVLGPELSDVIERAPFVARDPHLRERHSIAVRRAAWSRSWRPPTISVLLASRRPADLPEAIRMVRSQRGCELQLCVGLHGPEWPDDSEAAIRAAFDGPLVVDRFADTVDLGTMLDALGCRADGDFVTKWDDDDHYGADHLVDLVSAIGYTGAQIVGKAAEFVHLESIDTTIRRYAIGAESYSTTLAGGTLLLSAETLRDVGGWPAASSRVDGLLIDEILRRGGSSYRTHGFQFVLRRRRPSSTLGHTWTAPDEYFLRDAVDQRPGLDLVFAGIATAAAADRRESGEPHT